MGGSCWGAAGLVPDPRGPSSVFSRLWCEEKGSGEELGHKANPKVRVDPKP